jgi:hypothetical protein
LGYKKEFAKAGLLPDEFIWAEYSQKAARDNCLQAKIIQYLNNHSRIFTLKYGAQLEKNGSGCPKTKFVDDICQNCFFQTQPSPCV